MIVWAVVAAKEKANETNENKLKEALLIQNIFKADVNAPFGPWNNADHWTPIAVASHMGFADVVSILRLHGANPLLGTNRAENIFDVIA